LSVLVQEHGHEFREGAGTVRIRKVATRLSLWEQELRGWLSFSGTA
jgi:hypothetical protein